MESKKQLLIESCGVLHKPLLKEDVDPDEKKWTATIWRLDEVNLNGHMYSRALAEKLIAEKHVTVAYDGHDTNWITGEEYGIARAVCSNARIEGNELRVDIDFVDLDYKELLERLVEKGVAIGVSSVGFGDVNPTTGEINPDTYSLVRFLDFVTMPAGNVYARMEERKRFRGLVNTSESLDEEECTEAMAERREKVAEGLLNYLRRR